jgi:glycerophosphoryl diester phosphodiesterase
VTGKRPRLAAHRGGAGIWPENSLIAFRNAIGLGVDDVELDLHMTDDGGLAVIHDRTLERTTSGRGPVSACPAASLTRLRVRGPDGALTDEHVPTFDEVLALVASSSVGLLVEIKAPGPGPRWERRAGAVRHRVVPRYEDIEGRVLAALARSGMTGRASVMAFDPGVVARVRILAPSQPTTLLVGAGDLAQVSAKPAEAVAWAREVGATSLGLAHNLVDATVVRAVRAAGLVLGVWTVDAESEMRRLAALGVDEITTDRPDVARQLFDGEAAGGTRRPGR